MFPSPNPHTQLQAIESVESADPLAIHPPAFAAQQHPDPQIPKPRSRVGEISNPYPQRRVIRGPTPPIPGGPTELREATGPQATDLKGALEPRGQFPAACGP